MSGTEIKFYDLLSHIIIDDNGNYFLNNSIIEMYASDKDENTLLETKLNNVINHLNKNLNCDTNSIDILFENF